MMQTQPFEKHVWAEIDLEALRHNFRVVKARAGALPLCAVVKADSYGHGAVQCARVFAEEGAAWLAVSCLTEAVQLRKGGLTLPILVLGHVQPGQCASYGRRFTAEKPTKVATLCTGYADGYPRQLSCGKGVVEIHGVACPVLGRVCMDQMMVDVTDVPEVREDDEAILWGGTVSDTAETIARKTDTISYEVLCGVSRRVPRVYRDHGQIVAVEDWILEA